MGMGQATPGTTLAEVRARTALRGAGLDPTVPLERASSVTNEVWLTATHAVRVNRRPTNRLYRESLVAAVLPPEVGYPKVVAHGGGRGEDWLVAERMPGEPLAHRWPDLSDARAPPRRRAAGRAARRAPPHPRPGRPPSDRARPAAARGRRQRSHAARWWSALHRAMTLKHVDPVMLADAAELVARLAPALVPFEADTLVHGDVTFENVLWHEGEVTALLDVEWARPGPRDLDLDILLRCAAYPDLHVGEAHVERTRAEDYAEVPWWLGKAYPALFEYPRQIDRVRVYSIAYDVRDLLASPPAVAPRHLPDRHAYHRLQRVVERKSYIDVLGRGRI